MIVRAEATSGHEPTNVREGTVLFELVRALTRAGEYNAQDQTPPSTLR